VAEENHAVSFDEPGTDVCICTLEQTLLAVKGSYVQRVLPCQQITHVPGCPDFVLGVIYVRGNIESVIDLRSVAAIPKTGDLQDGKILIVEDERMRTGILFDAVEEMFRLSDAQIEPPVHTLPEGLKPLVIGTFSWHERPVVLLDMAQVISRICEGG